MLISRAWGVSPRFFLAGRLKPSVLQGFPSLRERFGVVTPDEIGRFLRVMECESLLWDEELV